MTATSDDVLKFWRDAGPDKWFRRDKAFDDVIRERFLETYENAAIGVLAEWEQTADGALALLIVLDQFPRNMFRGTARAFAADRLARAIADHALNRGFDQQVPEAERMFFYLPFEHSESMADQEHCIRLAKANGNIEVMKYAELHANVIRRFGRFPHRNSALGRETTPEEKEFLDSGGFAGN